MTDRLREHLVRSHLAGEVATSPGNVLDNCGKLATGDPEYTFGLSDWRDADAEDAVAAVRKLCGDEAVDGAPDGPGWIDPDATLEAIAHHNATLRSVAGRGRSRVLLATGHPTGLLTHYQAIARCLRGRGLEVLAPLDDEYVVEEPHRVGLRFLDGVGVSWRGGDLLHRHRGDLMAAMLDHLAARDELPDLVVGDHGMAGAAVERGLTTLAIADVNDPALPLAQVRGRTEGVLVIDDNLAPCHFVPVTAEVLDGVGEA